MAIPPDLPNEIYSQGFAWPQAYRRLFELGLTNLPPWRFLEGEELVQAYKAVNEQHPGRHVVPFAHRLDNADVACFTVLVGIMEQRVLLIQSTGPTGLEMEFPTLWDWFRLAVDDLIESEEQQHLP